MTMETAVFVNQLDSALPVTGDQVAEGDDHLRLLKTVLKNTFPGRAGAEGRTISKGAGYTPSSTEIGATFNHTAALTVTLPALAALPDGTFYGFKAQNGVTIFTPNGTDTIDGAGSAAMPVGSWSIFSKSGTTWVARIAAPPGSSSFATGTKLMFAQASAPTGWTQVTTDEATNRMLRVVNTAVHNVAGTHSPILNNVVPSHVHALTIDSNGAAHTHTGTTGTESAAHTHNMNIYQMTGTSSLLVEYNRGTIAAGSTITSTTESAAHTHSFTTASSSATHSHIGTAATPDGAADWTPRYIDMILCSKD